jgi:hypothetical protein
MSSESEPEYGSEEGEEELQSAELSEEELHSVELDSQDGESEEIKDDDIQPELETNIVLFNSLKLNTL